MSQVLPHSTSTKSISFGNLVNNPDPYWQSPVNINVTRTYPQAISVVDAACRLMTGTPISEVGE